MKKNTEYWENGLKKRANERNFVANLEEYKSDVHDQALFSFMPRYEMKTGLTTSLTAWK